MNHETAKIQTPCPREEIAAYIDGELKPWMEIELEMHFAGCKICKKELNSQKTLLCALDQFRSSEKEFELPEDFTKVVVTTAESNVSGLRRPQERQKALFICASLFAFVLLVLGGESEAVLGTFREFAEQFLAVIGFAAHLVFDFMVGVTIILRFLGNHFVFGSASSFGLITLLFIISLFMLSRLVGGYRRA
jgi:hypothetical protein